MEKWSDPWFDGSNERRAACLFHLIQPVRDVCGYEQ